MEYQNKKLIVPLVIVIILTLAVIFSVTRKMMNDRSDVPAGPTDGKKSNEMTREELEMKLKEILAMKEKMGFKEPSEEELREEFKKIEAMNKEQNLPAPTQEELDEQLQIIKEEKANIK